MQQKKIRMLVLGALFSTALVLSSCAPYGTYDSPVPYRVENHTGKTIAVVTDYGSFDLAQNEISATQFSHTVYDSFTIDSVSFVFERYVIYNRAYVPRFVIGLSGDSYTITTEYDAAK